MMELDWNPIRDHAGRLGFADAVDATVAPSLKRAARALVDGSNGMRGPAGRAALLSLCLALFGCPNGANEGGEPDATTYCWRGEADVEPRGEVELGTGREEFESLEGDLPELEIEQGTQGGFHFIVNARMEGLDPGHVDADRAEQPQTLATAYWQGEQVSVRDCPFSEPYVEADGSFVIRAGRRLVLERDISTNLYGEEVELHLEVVDKEYGYASDEVLVRAVEEE